MHNAPNTIVQYLLKNFIKTAEPQPIATGSLFMIHVGTAEVVAVGFQKPGPAAQSQRIPVTIHDTAMVGGLYTLWFEIFEKKEVCYFFPTE